MNVRVNASSKTEKLLRVLLSVVALASLGLLAMAPLEWRDQALLGLALICGATIMSRLSRTRITTLALIFISAFCSVRYAYWRVTQIVDAVSINPSQTIGVDLIFVVVLLAAEGYSIAILLLCYFQTLRPLRRPPVAMPDDAETWPSVDVLIPTFNEPLEIVRSAILAALNLDWPADKLKVYVLDDGCRPEFEEFAAASGAGYITRSEHRHAKAGNINNALSVTNGEYVAVFDCDHIATRSFLQMTMGCMVQDRGLGMVQTPHYFYSPDPFERNLGIHGRVPNEGALFYGVVQDGNDFWNATTFCGSCAVIRRKTLDEIGGIAVETVTEDAHSSLRMQRKGWGTAYMRIPVAAGLATASLADHIGQRIRWARGMTQILRIENPLFVSGLTLAQRLCYFNGMLHFLYAVPRLIFLTAPLIYLLFGRSNFYGYVVAIGAYAFPHLVLSTITSTRIQGRYRYSFWNEVYETVLAPYILMPTLVALIAPRRGKFNVTLKKRHFSGAYFDWRIARPYLFLLALNLLGIGLAIPHLFSQTEHLGTILINVLWAACNSIFLGAAASVAWEKRQVRGVERLPIRLTASMQDRLGALLEVTTTDLSSAGAAVSVPKTSAFAKGDRTLFKLSRGNEDTLMTTVVDRQDGIVRLRFDDLTLAQQEQLTRIIYGRADSWVEGLQARQHDRPLTNMGMIIRTGLRGILSIPRGLLSHGGNAPAGHPAPAPSKPRVAHALPIIIIAALTVLLMALRANAAPQETPHRAGRSFSDTLDLRSLGQKQPLVLRGRKERAAVNFILPASKIAGDASLMLSYTTSPRVDGAHSQIEVALNGNVVAQMNLARAAAEQGPSSAVQIPLPADLIMTDNTLTFNVRHEGIAKSAASDVDLWTRIELSTQVRIAGAVLPLANDLHFLPAPFFDRSRRQARIPVVFAEQPDKPTLEAAGVVASWLGVMADYRQVHLPTEIGEIPAGNPVLFAIRSSRLAQLISGGDDTGPGIYIRDNPSDPFGKVLVICGENSAGILTAARALASGQVHATGDHALVTNFRLPPERAPYDAPRWLAADRLQPVALNTSREDLKVFGSGSANIYFRLPPDFFVGSRRTSVPLTLRFRCSGLVGGSESELRVRLNGSQIAAKPISSDNTVQEVIIQAPTWALYQSNTLSVEFFLDRNNRSSTGVIPEAVLRQDSSIDLRGIGHFVKLPRVDLFTKAGFPFTRFADLSQTGVILPVSAKPDQIASFLDFAAFLGAQTGYPGLRIAVADSAHLNAVAGKDLLVIGTVEDQPLFSQWTGMPVSFNRKQMQIIDPQGGLQQLPWTKEQAERRQLSALLNGDEAPEAILQAFASPLQWERTVVALTTMTADNPDPAIAQLTSPSYAGDVTGNLMVLQHGRVHSFHLKAASYHLGSLRWLEAMHYWLQLYLWPLPLIVAVCAHILSGVIDSWAERYAAIRLQIEE